MFLFQSLRFTFHKACNFTHQFFCTNVPPTFLNRLYKYMRSQPQYKPWIASHVDWKWEPNISNWIDKVPTLDNATLARATVSLPKLRGSQRLRVERRLVVESVARSSKLSLDSVAQLIDAWMQIKDPSRPIGAPFFQLLERANSIIHSEEDLQNGPVTSELLLYLTLLASEGKRNPPSDIFVATAVNMIGRQGLHDTRTLEEWSVLAAAINRTGNSLDPVLCSDLSHILCKHLQGGSCNPDCCITILKTLRRSNHRDLPLLTALAHWLEDTQGLNMSECAHYSAAFAAARYRPPACDRWIQMGLEECLLKIPAPSDASSLPNFPIRMKDIGRLLWSLAMLSAPSITAPSLEKIVSLLTAYIEVSERPRPVVDSLMGLLLLCPPHHPHREEVIRFLAMWIDPAHIIRMEVLLGSRDRRRFYLFLAALCIEHSLENLPKTVFTWNKWTDCNSELGKRPRLQNTIEALKVAGVEGVVADINVQCTIPHLDIAGIYVNSAAGVPFSIEILDNAHCIQLDEAGLELEPNGLYKLKLRLLPLQGYTPWLVQEKDLGPPPSPVLIQSLHRTLVMESHQT